MRRHLAVRMPVYTRRMDSSSRFDLRQLQESLEGVDHALIRLTPMISERLLIDFRTNEHGGPAWRCCRR